MKRFRTISSLFIGVIAVIFAFNVFYLVELYSSIRHTVQRDVMSALADSDVDEMWIRIEKHKSIVVQPTQSAQVTTLSSDKSTIRSTTRYSDGQVSARAFKLNDNDNFTNKFFGEVSKQLHSVIDSKLPVDMAVIDSVFRGKLADRFIHPDFVSVEVIDSTGTIVHPGTNQPSGSYDEFVYEFNPDAGHSYRARITPLTGQIMHRMSGVIVTVLLMLVAFSLAFWYLMRTVSRLRSLEEMKDDFVNNMTHELKTPIAIAYSANDALLNYETGNNPEKRDTYLRIANRQLKRLGELVENILAMSMERRKTMVLNRETVQLRPLIDDIAAAHRMRAEKTIDIAVDVPQDLCVSADRTHLGNVLNNLIDNAIKYSNESVNIVITASSDGLSVADNGIGIPTKSLPFVFDKFYRVPHGNTNDIRGYGIGLYYVRSIVDKMGWTVSATSREGHGSVFTIKFGKNEN